MLVTQNQSSLNWNSSFNKQEQGNSNETFKLEFPAEIKIQSDIKTAKKLEAGGIEYLEFPSSNVEINSALNSSVSSATAVNSAVNSATAVNSALSQTTAVSQTATTTTAYGYSVDSKGFMGADFNKAAGLPQDFKIHKSTLDEFVEVSHKNSAWNATLHTNFRAAQRDELTEPSYFKNIDVAANFGAYYAQFESVVRTSQSTFSPSDLANLPKGYSLDYSNATRVSGLLKLSSTNVSNVYNVQQVRQIKDLNDTFLGAEKIIVTELDFSIKNMIQDRNASEFKFNPDMSVYERDDGLYSRESVFIAFMKSNGAMAYADGDTEYFNPNYDEVEAKKNDGNYTIYDVIDGKIDFAKLAKMIIDDAWLDIWGKADEAEDNFNSFIAQAKKLLNETRVQYLLLNSCRILFALYPTGEKVTPLG